MNCAVFCGVTAFALLCAASVSAAPKRFDFQDPKAMNAVALSIDAPWEPEIGRAHV